VCRSRLSLESRVARCPGVMEGTRRRGWRITTHTAHWRLSGCFPGMENGQAGWWRP